MISHGSWYKQIEKERESNSQDTRGGERKGNRQVKNKRRDEVKETDEGMEVRRNVHVWKEEGERSTSKSTTQTLI